MSGQHLRDLPVFLRAPRAAGLWLVGVLIPVATVAGFVLSYRGLFEWAVTHGWPWYLAPLFPLLIDLLIIAGEVVLFVAAIDGSTPLRVRMSAWGIVLVFTTLSVVGNVDHAPTSDPLTRGGWGLPPLVMAIALGFGLGELKRQAAKYREPEETGTPGEVPSSSLHAARMRLKAAADHGFKVTPNDTQERFGLTRAAARGLHAEFAPKEAPAVVPPATAGALNGHGGRGG